MIKGRGVVEVVFHSNGCTERGCWSSAKYQLALLESILTSILAPVNSQHTETVKGTNSVLSQYSSRSKQPVTNRIRVTTSLIFDACLKHYARAKSCAACALLKSIGANSAGISLFVVDNRRTDPKQDRAFLIHTHDIISTNGMTRYVSPHVFSC